MKKLLFLGLSVLVAALPAGAENKIQMVTYFPVPYVAYSQINPTKQLDVGLSSACEMNLGCQESGEAGLYPLQVTTELLLNKGRLDFNTAAAVYSASASIGNGYGVAHLDFSDNLRLTTLTNGYTMEADQMTVDTLNLFPDQIKNSFPSCAAVSGSTNISWQNLKLNKDTETYLMCGTPKQSAATCSDRTYKLAHKSECCASASQTDTDCWTEQIKWSGVKSETNSQAIFQCSQTNTYDPHRTCGVKCTGKATAKGESRCASLSGACYRVGEICMIQTTYCPVWTGSYTMSEPNCNCQGGAVLNKTYQECVRTYVKNGW